MCTLVADSYTAVDTRLPLRSTDPCRYEGAGGFCDALFVGGHLMRLLLDADAAWLRSSGEGAPGVGQIAQTRCSLSRAVLRQQILGC